MKFGQSENPEMIEFQLPSDDPQAAEILKKNDASKPLTIYYGLCQMEQNRSEELLSAQYQRRVDLLFKTIQLD